jgi:hypothetical protein
MKEKMTQNKLQQLLDIPATQPAVKGAAIISAAKSYAIDEWMVAELKAQWEYTTPHVGFPLPLHQ